MKQLYKYIIIIMVISVSIMGCNKGDTVDDLESTTLEETDDLDVIVEEDVEQVVKQAVVPDFGGTLRVAALAPTTFDPLLNVSQSVQQILEFLYEPLFELDETLLPIPILVNTYEFEEEGRILKLTLKPEITFHNGEVLTTQDVKYSIEQIKEAEYSIYQNNVKAIQKVTIIDDLTLKIYYNQGYAFALDDLSFPIVSKSYHQSEDYNALIPVGTGPYQYVDYQKMQHIDLTAYTDWHLGDVYVENIKCIIIQDDTSLETLFDQDLIDVMNPNKFNWLKYSENEEQKIESYTSNYYDFIGFNFDNELFNSKSVRQAFAYAINRESIVNDRFINHATIVDTPIIPGTWFDDQREINYTYDLETAKNIIGTEYVDHDQDGIFDDEDLIESGIYSAITLNMLVNKDNMLRVDATPIIKMNLESLGFKIVVDMVDSTTYYERLKSGDFDLVYGGWKLSSVPDYTELFASFGTQNYINYHSEKMDELLNNIYKSYTNEQIIQGVSAFSDYMVDEVPYISLYFLNGAIMSHSNLYGSFKPTTESMYRNIEDIYLDFIE